MAVAKVDDSMLSEGEGEGLESKEECSLSHSWILEQTGNQSEWNPDNEETELLRFKARISRVERSAHLKENEAKELRNRDEYDKLCIMLNEIEEQLHDLDYID